MAAENLRRPRRTGTRRQSPAQRPGKRPPAPRLPAHRHARRGQNHHRPHPRQKPQLRTPQRRRTLRPMPILPRHRYRPLRRPARNRRRLQHRHRQHPRSTRKRPIRPDRRQIQSLHHRRSTHALQKRVQRHAQNPGRAARARQIHPRHHRPAQSPRYRTQPLPAIRPAQHDRPTSGRPPRTRPRQRTNPLRNPRPRPARPCRRRLHARRTQPARPSHRHGVGQSGRTRRAPNDRRGGQTLPLRTAAKHRQPKRRGPNEPGAGNGRTRRRLRQRPERTRPPAATHRPAANRTRRRIRRRPRISRPQTPGGTTGRRTNPALLPMRHPRQTRPRPRSRRIRRLRHDPPAHAGLRPLGRPAAAHRRANRRQRAAHPVRSPRKANAV